jgi:hypothetical protein
MRGRPASLARMVASTPSRFRSTSSLVSGASQVVAQFPLTLPSPRKRGEGYALPGHDAFRAAAGSLLSAYRTPPATGYCSAATAVDEELPKTVTVLGTSSTAAKMNGKREGDTAMPKAPP